MKKLISIILVALISMQSTLPMQSTQSLQDRAADKVVATVYPERTLADKALDFIPILNQRKRINQQANVALALINTQLNHAGISTQSTPGLLANLRNTNMQSTERILHKKITEKELRDLRAAIVRKATTQKLLTEFSPQINHLPLYLFLIIMNTLADVNDSQTIDTTGQFFGLLFLSIFVEFDPFGFRPQA